MKNIRAFLHTALEGATIDGDQNLVLPPLRIPPQAPPQTDTAPESNASAQQAATAPANHKGI